MYTNNQIEKLLPEWLAEHAITIEQLNWEDSDINEILDDYVELNDAIDYWTGKSEQKVAEFTCLAEELKREIIQKCTYQQ